MSREGLTFKTNLHLQVKESVNKKSSFLKRLDIVDTFFLMILVFLSFVFVSLSFRVPHEYSYTHLGPDNVTQISGYITVNGTLLDGSHLFYWFFESRTDPENAPFVVWLTGGPGCSSMNALLTENGPYYLKSGELEINPYSWNSFANIMWVDQPTGTGYSYTDNIFEYVINEKQVAKDMWVFLEEFFQEFPKYQEMDLFLIGESYAGHYVPAISYKIYEANEKKEGPIQLNMKGLAIGNGWVDPYNQYPAYAEYAKTYGLINELEYDADIAAAKICQEIIKTGVWIVALYECQLYFEAVMEEISIHEGYQINPYNYKVKCELSEFPICYNFEPEKEFYNDEDVKKALGVKKDKKWVDCNMLVHTFLLGDWMTDLETHIPTILQKYHVLVYSGELDLICNWKGGEAWTSDMKWKYQKEFNDLSYSSWNISGKGEVGKVKEYDNLTFLRVADAGHMVPMDQPQIALEMLNYFLHNTPFSEFEN